MQLSNLAGGLKLPDGASGLDITGLTADSRTVQAGFLFAALEGAAVDGARFAPQAVEAGAVAVLCAETAALDLSKTLPGHVAIVASKQPRRDFALMAARFYNRQPDVIVAVTGTAGKTSVAHFTRQIFQMSGHAAASLGTIGTISPDGAVYGGLTTPDPVSLHAELARLADDGVTHVAMEASSHGLDQRRLDGVHIVAAAFTNLGRDHMDYHATMEDYFEAKLRLFKDLLPQGGTLVADPSAPYADRVLTFAADRGLRTLTVGPQGRDLRLARVETVGLGQFLTVEAGGRTLNVTLPLIGDFQVSNALIAAGLAIGAGVRPETAVRALESLKGAPGRLEFAGRTRTGGAVYIDYAHKPDAVEKALAALRPFTKGTLSVIIGAGGDRDPGKRVLMGAAAARNADMVIVTDDNPRSEDPALIRKAVLEGAPGALEIADRAKAIEEAVRRLQAGDILCVAGKGHETGQIVGNTVLPFSDHEAVKAALLSGEKQ
ncbi:UDP-N-acetylmuramoyl-L-alanyl-D-glutamate--2,6-diaminopimelate ligase [Roseibium aquae]|uniref:UDP-N-acetylmuramoyl-L-alanyl-D-glutamate--2,6-diaminopimelate ligase n=1 Tax=Roseibium aquae TaxID=1323746 RepID=A0A916WX26_9HYPH|nr:UDP-N-acetylmuramoyl-L-alanyl-D-glutamate--2,6-diaminopimelate ligase [Roseibium aquae]GGB36647.1 UDP-N-acetylmuramoyl-L-alanyl-D-glutamate--2,6-diaminopimelate ligase [Roseibium aquae]